MNRKRFLFAVALGIVAVLLANMAFLQWKGGDGFAALATALLACAAGFFCFAFGASVFAKSN